jgi:hypothetical protein
MGTVFYTDDMMLLKMTAGRRDLLFHMGPSYFLSVQNSFDFSQA